VFVKPNFVFPDPNCVRTTRDFALFVGRLSSEKGIGTLISAWKSMGQRRLKIVGDGPAIAALRRPGSVQSNIDLLGHRESHEVLKLMEQAAFLVLPSEWYEAFPRVIVEAFAQGLPVLGSRLGSIQELVHHGRTGLLFQPGNPQELASAAEWLFRHPVELEAMSKAARLEFEQKYTAERNYEQLMAIYRHVLSQRELQSRPMEGVAAHSLSS
jgi:glycosyltransferase involved in cell wall biosynthesis